MENIINVSGEIEAQGTTNFKLPKQHIYKPKEDITTYELAQIIPVFNPRDLYSTNILINSLPDNCKRHFEEVE